MYSIALVGLLVFVIEVYFIGMTNTIENIELEGKEKMMRKTLKGRMLAIFLAFTMFVSLLPSGIFTTVFAAVGNYTVTLQDENGKTLEELNDVLITLTKQNSPDETMAVSTKEGVATFTNFVEADATYEIQIEDVVGYDTTITSFQALDTNRNIEMSKVETVSVSGMVTDDQGKPYEGASVNVLGYANNIQVTTNDSGAYSFKTNKGKLITIQVLAKEEDPEFEMISHAYSYTGDKVNEDFQFAIKHLQITATGYDASLGEVQINQPTVLYGDSSSAVIKAKDGYRIKSLEVNGEEVLEAKDQREYNLNLLNIKEDQKIRVIFYKATYKVIFDVQENGEVIYDTDQHVAGGTVKDVLVEEGNQLSFKAVADSKNGYHVEKVTVDSNDILKDGTNDVVTFEHTIKDGQINTEMHVVVEFALNEYTVTLKSDGNGEALLLKDKADEGVADHLTVKYGDQIYVKLIPDENYNPGQILVGSQDIACEEIEDGYLSAGIIIKDNQEVTVSFEEKKEFEIGSYALALPQNYKTIGDVTYVPEGSTVTITAQDPYTRVKINSDWSKIGKPTYEEKVTKGKDITSIETAILPNRWSTPNLIHIQADGTKPTISSIENDGKWFKDDTNAIYSFNVDDTQSGVKEVKYSKTNDILTATILQPEEGIYSFKAQEDGEFNGKYYIWVVDYCGNTLDATVDVCIDSKNPTISAYSFDNEEHDMNFEDHGMYSSTDVEVTVTASDAAISSGIDKITLYCDNKEYQTLDASNGSATFVLKEKDFRQQKSISAVATDRAGRVSERMAPSQVDGEKYKNDQLAINSNKPNISINPEEAIYTDPSGKQWYKNDVMLDITALGNGTGIREVTIKINGETLTADSNGKNLGRMSGKNAEESFRINTNLVDSRNGLNTIEVTVRTNTGVRNTLTEKVYIDRESPEIVHYEITRLNNNPIQNFIHFLTFGTFFNEQVNITVTAADEDGTNAGVKAIQLYLSGEYYDEKVVDKNNQATFVISAEQLEEEQVYTKEITAIAIDNVTNLTNEPVAPSKENSDGKIKSSKIMLETVLPEVAVTADSPASEKNEATMDEKDWYQNDVSFNITVKDADSGIQSVLVKINDDVLVDEIYCNGEDKDVETKEEQYTVSTKDAKINEDGSYTLTVQVIDNAGNVNDAYKKTVYKDSTKPEVVKYEFMPTDYIEADLSDLAVESTDYGFYFKQETQITIYAEDLAPTSGVKAIAYYTVDYTTNENGEMSNVNTALVDEDNSITFVIPANFKGQIFAKAIDNVDNEQETFVTPEGVIIEFDDKHAEEEHILFDKPDTSFKTNDGNDLYADDIDVTLMIVDTYSGIRDVEWTVQAPYDTENNQKGNVTVDNEGKLSDDSWEKVETENNLVTKLQKTIRVNNNSNHIVLNVVMKDRAGNTSEEQIEFSIDKTNPLIEIAYGNDEVHDDQYTSYFNTSRTATITITERNFDPKDVTFKITNTDKIIPNVDLKSESAWKTIVNEEDPDQTKHVATVTYTNDGDYTFDISYHDNAEREANKINQHKFTIDKVKPVLTVRYDNNSALNGNYYDAYRIATLTIKEHNFDSSRVNVLGVATDNGEAKRFPATSKWRKVATDTYQSTIQYNFDSKYEFDIEYRDMANNSIDDFKVQEFYVDTTAPELEITGIEDRSSNNDTVSPRIIYSDTNFDRDGVTINLTGVNNGVVHYSGQYADSANGQTYTYANFEKIEKVDDIYTLSASLTDLAGNRTEKTIQFSVNRFGSVYDLSSIKDILNKYIKTERDIVFTETNVDALSQDEIEIILTKNGTPTTLKLGEDYSLNMSGGNDSWSVYTYTIFKSLFSDDGTYSIAVHSIDKAGNVNENNEESKKAEITFGIDKTDPVIVALDLESNAQYAFDHKEFSFEIKDNLVLDNVTVYLNDEEVAYTVENNRYIVDIPESNYLQNIRIVATDSAGNETELLVENFIVSTNFLVRWYNNKPLFIGSWVVIIAAAAGIFFLVYRKRNQEEEK